MLKAKDGSFFIKDWLRNRNTLEFLGIWESLYNPDFNWSEFALIKDKSGLNSFNISVKEWIRLTGAKGIMAKKGRYGGTYAHRDIAFEFGSWISATFKLYLIREYQRMKEAEVSIENGEWNVRRILSKANHHIQADAVKKHIIPRLNYSKKMEWIAYAAEADLVNIALFGCSAKDWREANPELIQERKNMRDMASINELAVLSNLESMNAEMIKSGMDKRDRFEQLQKIAAYQLNILNEINFQKSLKMAAKGRILTA